MAEVTQLRHNAIVRNAAVGATPPHGQVKTGELPLVNVKMTPSGPQVQEGQQKAVQVLAPNSKGAVAAGHLPMVNVKMTQNGPQLDNGQNNAVVIKDKQGAVAAGHLPMVNVTMENGRPQVKTLPNVQGGPPQIPSAVPALSVPRGAPVASQGYVARPPIPVANQARVARVAAPQAQPQVVLPAVPALTSDQLMFCRHSIEKNLKELLAAEVPVAEGAEAPVKSDVVQFAEMTLSTIDDILVATAVRAEAEAKAAMAAQAPAVAAAPAPAGLTIGAPAASSIAPAPSVAYNAGRVTGRSYIAGGARAQRNAGMAPRRTARTGPPLPPVIVKMDGQKAVLQNSAELAEAKAAAAAPVAVPVTEQAPVIETPVTETSAVADGSAQG